MRAEVPATFHDALLNGIKEGEKRMKFRKKLKIAAAAAAVVSLFITVSVFAARPADDTTVQRPGSSDSDPLASVAISPTPTTQDSLLISPTPTAPDSQLTGSPVISGTPAPGECNGEQSETFVYTTKGGIYYHSVSDCSGMENAECVSLDEALEAGKKACPMCESVSVTIQADNEVCRKLEQYMPGTFDCLTRNYDLDNLVFSVRYAENTTYGEISVGENSVIQIDWDNICCQITADGSGDGKFIRELLNSVEDTRINEYYESSLKAVKAFDETTRETEISASEPELNRLRVIYSLDGAIESACYTLSYQGADITTEINGDSGTVTGFYIDDVFFEITDEGIASAREVVSAESYQTDATEAGQASYADNLICEALYMDPTTAIDVLFNAPVLTQDNDGTGWGNDDEMLEIGPGYILYSTSLGRNLDELVNCSMPEVMYRNTETEIPDAITKYAQNVSEGLGLSLELIHSQFYEEAELRSNIDETMIADCYVLCYACKENGITVSADSYHYTDAGAGFDGPQVLMIITNDGLQYLSASGLYTVTGTQSISTPLLKASYACDKAKMDYGDYNADICAQRLEYIKKAVDGQDPQEAFILVPAWIIMQRNTFDTGTAEPAVTYSVFALIDAHTGEEY